jgi:hypothetical protein
MKSRSIALAVLVGLLVNVVGFAGDNTHGARAKKRQTTRLVAMLPASDGVAVFDSKRFLNEALPKVLAANQPLLSEITTKLSEIENKSGIDLRKFDQVAVGVAYKQISPTETDYDTVVLASGDISAGALVGVAKQASNGTYREEKVGNRTVFVFTPKDVIQKTTVKTTNSKISAAIDHFSKSFSKEIAIASIDRNTIAIGTLARVRETLEGGSHPSADITGLLSTRVDSVGSFAGRVPGGMSRLLPLDNDELGKNLSSIQLVAGSMDVTALGTSVQMLARTSKPEQATALKETLDGLQLVGSAILGGSKRADQQIYGRMIKNAKFAARGTEVTLDLAVPQADIDTLVATIK